MENKIGEIQSDITLDDLKMLIKCRYKRGDRGLMAIGILFLLAAMADYIYMHFVGFTSHPYEFIIFALFIFWLQVKNISSCMKNCRKLAK